MRKGSTVFIIFVFALSATLGAVSCSGSATIATDRPELAFAAAVFNASQTRFHVDVEFSADLARRIADREINPACAIGVGLASPEALAGFSPLDSLFGEYLLAREDFYDALLDAGTTRAGQVLLPLSFNLPLVAWVSDDNFQPEDDFSLALADLKTASLAFQADPKKKPPVESGKIGFSLRFQPEFMIDAANAHGAGFRAWHLVSWDAAALDAMAGDAVAWTDGLNGGVQAENDFSFRYLLGPASKWLLDGRVRFALMSSRDYFRLPEDTIASLDFRWLSGSKGIPVMDDVVFAGLNENVEGYEIAREFLIWLFRPETQLMLLEKFREYRASDASFGFMGGLSAVRETSERGLINYYTPLIGRFPAVDALIAPEALPIDWPAIKRDVLIPGLVEACDKRPAESATGILQRIMDEWIKTGGNSGIAR